MQEYLPALLPLTIGLGAFAVGIIFALRERNERMWRQLRDLKREQMQQELDFDNAPRKTG
jgi:Kef-type K+ transport system membrane component KefB